MLSEIHRARFLKPSELVYEILVLQQIKSANPAVGGQGPNRQLTDTIIEGYLKRLQESGMIDSRTSQGETVVELNAAGEQQLRVLLVDYIRELMRLHQEVIEIFRKRLGEFYLAGIRRVAFYPIGDTAEVVYSALQGSGLSLSLAVDDDPLLWGANFHEVHIESPKQLVTADIDGIVLTTSVFENEIRGRIEPMGDIKGQLLSLWEGLS